MTWHWDFIHGLIAGVVIGVIGGGIQALWQTREYRRERCAQRKEIRRNAKD